MRRRLFKRLIGLVTALLLLAAVLIIKLDWHWSLRAVLWISALAGLVWATWNKTLPETRDDTARAAQPGLYEGSQYGSGGGDGNAG